MRSRNAAARVRKLGYTRALSLSGGLGAWRQANLPVETQKA
jgi:rhodanese-related sulfurtransferase